MPVADIIAKYSAILQDVSEKTSALQKNLPEIPCKNKCFTCCEQLFPITFLEAYAISNAVQTMNVAERAARTLAAQKTNDTLRVTIPFDYLRKHGVTRDEALKVHTMLNKALHIGQTDCPALNKNNPDGACTVYGSRPHECRVQGFSFSKHESESSEVVYNKEFKGQIIGCFRFDDLQHLTPKLMDYNYRYEEKLALDFALIRELTGGEYSQEIMYYTTMCMPFLKDYSSTDWKVFFREHIPENMPSGTYSVVVDV